MEIFPKCRSSQSANTIWIPNTINSKLFIFFLVALLRHRFAWRLVKNFRHDRGENCRARQLLHQQGSELNVRWLWMRSFLRRRLPWTLKLYNRTMRYVDRHRSFDYCSCTITRRYLCFHVGQEHSTNEVNPWSSPMAIATKSWSSNKPILLRKANGS